MTTHGGSRNRSGPTQSAASERAGLSGVRWIDLEITGYAGDFPALSEYLPGASEREGLVWAEAWRTPQAGQWIKEPYRIRTVAMWVRWSVRAEDLEASAATINAATRLADQIGLTPAGLRENGWIVDPRVADVPTESASTTRAGRAASRTNGGGKKMQAVRGRRD